VDGVFFFRARARSGVHAHCCVGRVGRLRLEPAEPEQSLTTPIPSVAICGKLAVDAQPGGDFAPFLVGSFGREQKREYHLSWRTQQAVISDVPFCSCSNKIPLTGSLTQRKS
jgi:hypothetical protein